jgi:type IV pilus assembly protein PilY1
MGESWSMPITIRVKGIAAPLVVFGAGYDSCEDDEDPVAKCAPSGVTIEKGRGVVVLDAEKGTSVAANYRFIGVASGELDTSAGRFVADIAPVDINNDGYVDVLYAVDTRGNIWRINTSNPNPSTGSPYDGYTNGVADWKVSKVGVVSDWSVPAEKRKLMNAPSTVKLGNQVTVLVGSGDREKPSATSNASKVENRFYGIRDDVSVTTSVPLAIGYGPESSIPIPSGKNNLKNVTNSTSFDPTLLNDPLRGWYLNLSSASEPYEQVVTTPLTLAGVTYFSTYQAKAPSASANACTNLGTARGYQVDFQTGTQVGNLPVATEFLSQGMPPSPVGGVVMVDGKPVPFVIGGPGKTPITPKKVVPIVRPDRKPVFRTIRIDK